MVNVYLHVKDRQVLALSIPFSDIERLSILPVKWLRFVTFAICGVRGDLSAMPNGPPVNYDSISIDHIAEAYYYTPEADYHLIDHNAMNDQITSSEQTPCSSSFRRNVMARDGPMCVFTGIEGGACDAAHLLPKSKGDEYIKVVLQDRLNSYDPALEPDILSINSILHSWFARGHSAFLKTPNFALDPADIPRLFPIPQYDACMAGTGILPPSTVILDFMYGVAAYRRWGSGQDIKEVMKQRFAECYKSIPIPPASPHSSDSDSSSESRQPRERNHNPNMSDGMLRAMDNVLALSMLVKGTTPELMAIERQRQEEAEELCAKEASRVKVQEWMQSSLDIESQSNAASRHHENLPQ
ncbi:hypothetical protein B0F90DRAFT_1791095 [Multifurca ochricompacta]|uniref:Uncharacterized protein n=1 Tax=Multifurca ochricompacta TaxID=376703 RepID=A0AAD4LWE2_9AGAM|nr:hypothetical protein B0F90DRAFT_1791095 [Multifurca ochricompacta]